MAIPALYEVHKGVNGLSALDQMVKSIEKEIGKGANIIILSDRGV